jgi:hypothetical protein
VARVVAQKRSVRAGSLSTVSRGAPGSSAVQCSHRGSKRVHRELTWSVPGSRDGTAGPVEDFVATDKANITGAGGGTTRSCDSGYSPMLTCRKAPTLTSLQLSGHGVSWH